MVNHYSDDDTDIDAPSSKLREALRSLGHGLDQGLLSVDEYERITELLDAYNEDKPSVSKPPDESHRTKNTLATWSNRLRVVAKRLDTDMTEATADDLNRLWDEQLSGQHRDVKDDGLAKNTVSAQQSTTRRFYEYHEDLGVDKDDISVVGTEKNNVDERDIFTSEEIHAMRDEATHPRDQCLLDLLIYTGQRVRAVQTLRIRDINLSDATFYLNDEDGGLKGSDGKRPLLGAEGAVREWLDYHPNPDDPDAYLICHREGYRANSDASEPLSQKAIRTTLDRIADRAGIDKPSNPHNFRHSFVTIAKRKYDMDDTTIKGLIGHQIQSRVMEETYSHLKDEDHVRSAQRATGTREPEEQDSPFTPDFCESCDEPLPDDARACSSCGTVYTPDAKAAQETVEDTIHEGAKQAESDEERDAVDAVREYIKNNPEAVAENPELARRVLGEE